MNFQTYTIAGWALEGREGTSMLLTPAMLEVDLRDRMSSATTSPGGSADPGGGLHERPEDGKIASA